MESLNSYLVDVLKSVLYYHIIGKCYFSNILDRDIPKSNNDLTTQIKVGTRFFNIITSKP